MRPKSLILLLLALGCGLVASIGISQVMANRSQVQAPVVETEKILVANKDIKVNEPLSDKNVQVEDWPKEKVPSDAVHDLKDLDGQRAGGNILVGEPIRKAKFAVDKRIEEIPHGYRVVAVQADAVSATGNLLQPGDRVDIVLSIKHAGPVQGQSQVAKTILQNVRVFAINEQWRPSEGKDKSDDSITARTVSLLVTPDEAETISLASDLGRVRLVLRNPDDEEVADTSGTEENEILQGHTRTNPKPLAGGKTGGILDWLKKQSGAPQAAPNSDPDERFTMVVLKGDEVSHVEFTRKGKDGRWLSNAPDSNAAGVTPPSTPPAGPPTL
ncbi:MAG TPA: Flp pilus assembly protein CpaB [Pirellulales bacterium]|jgi:pilus assembly protein CpaB